MKVSRERFLMILGAVLTLLIGQFLPGCGGGGGGAIGTDGGGGGGGDGITVEEGLQEGYFHNEGDDCLTCHTTWNIVELHKATSPLYNDECINCHGYRLSDESLSASVTAIHPKMMPYVIEDAGEDTVNDEVCKYCHQSVDILGGSAGALRKQVAVDDSAGATDCAGCHGPGGEATEEFYE